MLKENNFSIQRAKRGQASYHRGWRAEILAAGYLMLRGYWIYHLRYRRRSGEIDIIARKGRVFVAVEVKARPNLQLGHESMNDAEWRRRRNAMAEFIRQKKRAGYSIRFDLIIVAPYLQIQHTEAAWQDNWSSQAHY
jgi:putative endonuclease